MSTRFIGVDWSGAVKGARRKIWLAEVDAVDGRVVRLEAGRSRARVADHLLEEASKNPDIIVGFDFAFSLPSWFLEERQLADAPALWALVATEGERWLAECRPPFWGRPNTRRPELHDHLRRTDREVPAVGGIRPKSVFQIGGAGAVGTGSLRGMPILLRLRQEGFAVWPFESARLPLVVEIYPRLLTGAVDKGNLDRRRSYLYDKFPRLDTPIRELGISCEDAFDALVSALVMAKHADNFLSLPAAEDDIRRREGKIWHP